MPALGGSGGEEPPDDLALTPADIAIVTDAVGDSVPPADIDKVVQEVILRYHRAVRDLRSRAAVAPLLEALTANVCREYDRSRHR